MAKTKLVTSQGFEIHEDESNTAQENASLTQKLSLLESK